MNWKLNEQEAAELEARVLVELGNAVLEIKREHPQIDPLALLQALNSRGYTIAELRSLECVAARNGM